MILPAIRSLPSPLRTYTMGTVDSTQAATGISFAAGSAPDEVLITVAAGVSAHTHFSTGAYLWWQARDIVTNEPIVYDQGARILVPRIEFVTLPDDSSNVEIGIALAPSASRTGNHNVHGGNFASATRRAFGARHLSGTTADTVQAGGLGVFRSIWATSPLSTLGTDTLFQGTWSVAGAAAADGRTRAGWLIGASAWDTLQIACNISVGDYVGLAVRAVGTTTATTASVRVRLGAMRLDR